MVRGAVATPCSVWICRGDSNKHYEGSSDPMQSFLFCIKAPKKKQKKCFFLKKYKKKKKRKNYKKKKKKKIN
jgi:hypothetical protein